ncbi:MAG: ABC transporter permease [Nitrospirota bacterium]
MIIWWRRLRAMTVKELRQLGRDAALLFFFLWAFTFNIYEAGGGINMQLRHARIMVHDADHSVSSRELLNRFHPPYFAFQGELPDLAEGQRLMDRGATLAILDIPPRFHESLVAREPTSVQLLVDTTSSPQGLSAASYAGRIVGEFGLDAAGRRAGPDAGEAPDAPVVTSQHRVWYNPEQNETWFQSVAELLSMITVFSTLLPAAALVRERERGTVEQLLVSPLTPFQIMFPKVIAMTLVIVTGTAASTFGIIQGVFHVPVKGSVILFFALTTLYVFTTAGLGLMIATFAGNQAQVGLMNILVVAPMLLLSGTWAPPEAMPEWVRGLMVFSPLHYFINIAYGILLKGSGLDLLWDSALTMALLGGALFGFGVWRFRRQFA